MITAWIAIGSVEFYVALAVVAAAIVALSVKPSGRGAARQYLWPEPSAAVPSLMLRPMTRIQAG